MHEARQRDWEQSFEDDVVRPGAGPATALPGAATCAATLPSPVPIEW